MTGDIAAQPGRRWLLGGSIGLLIVAVLHTLGHFAPPPPDPEYLRLHELMRAVRLDLGLARPTVNDIFTSLSLTMSITLVALGALGLILSRVEDPTGRVLRRGTATLAIAVAALVVLYAAYRIPPPLISFIIVELVFLVALVRARPRKVAVPGRAD